MIDRSVVTTCPEPSLNLLGIFLHWHVLCCSMCAFSIVVLSLDMLRPAGCAHFQQTTGYPAVSAISRGNAFLISGVWLMRARSRVSIYRVRVGIIAHICRVEVRGSRIRFQERSLRTVEPMVEFVALLLVEFVALLLDVCFGHGGLICRKKCEDDHRNHDQGDREGEGDSGMWACASAEDGRVWTMAWRFIQPRPSDMAAVSSGVPKSLRGEDQGGSCPRNAGEGDCDCESQKYSESEVVGWVKVGGTDPEEQSWVNCTCEMSPITLPPCRA